MTVKAIHLKNFMAFEDTDWVELRPITLLFGRNSSGKSVIIRALRFLKQSLTQSLEDSPFAYNAEHGVDVGSFDVMGHGEDVDPYEKGEKKISFGFRCGVLPEVLKYLLTSDSLKAIEKEPYVDIMLSFGQWQGKVILTMVEILRYGISGKDNENTIFYAELLGESPLLDDWYFGLDLLPGYKEDIESEIARYWSQVKIDLTHGFLPVLSLLPQVIKSGQSDQSEAEIEIQAIMAEDYRNIFILFQNCADSITSYFDSIAHLGPLRPSPKRLYMLDDSQQRHWELQGLDAFIRFLNDQLTDNERKEINFWLEKLELAESIKAIPLLSREESSAIVTRVELDEGKSSHHSLNLTDVGFGASQVIPIIIQSIVAKPGSLVVIEQPELHLHPRAQAELAGLFVEMARENVHFLLETHSEHLLLRLRRWTTEHTTGKRVLSDDQKFLKWGESVAYFIHRKNDISSVTRIGIDAYGDLENIPEGFEDFFSDDLLESVELTKLQLTSENSWDSDDEPDN